MRGARAGDRVIGPGVWQYASVPPLSLSDVRILVLAAGETPQGVSNARGHLFEVFVGRLLQIYGYSEPSRRRLNVSSDGIELDVTANSRLDGRPVIAECKAYTRPVAAGELSAFYGKLTVERFSAPRTLGVMVAIPRLTGDGEQHARRIRENDPSFLYLAAEDIVERLAAEGLIRDAPSFLGLVSDPAVVITQDGIFSAALILDAASRLPVRVAVWGVDGPVPRSTLELVELDEYAQGLPVGEAVPETAPDHDGRDVDSILLATVQGSKADFEYQLPASPKYFVGRKRLVGRLEEVLDRAEHVLVLNAQSGWGKSSLALKFADMAIARGGHALVMDTRTASGPRYVTETLRRAAIEAAEKGILALPADASWASLASALNTIDRAKWTAKKPLVVFFDQFENVFRSPDLTRTFRDLAIGAREVKHPLTIGFAWKTDLVGWTEDHPYQQRDEIRGSATVLVVEPFGSNEVSVLLNRLERELNEKLVPDLRNRLREYSQGLPWLLKKLVDHILRELRNGATQERLLAEALNVQSLFATDLAELGPTEQETLRHIARYAPIAAGEVTDRYPLSTVQSLVDRRLVVQVGERLDTYWDTFRDFLNTGRVPVEDSYILRQTPNGVARLLPLLVDAGGSAGVRELAERLETSDNVIFNLSRELRLLGVTVYEPNVVRFVDEISSASDKEAVLRRQVANALRRHRAYSTLREVAEKGGGLATADAFARQLPYAFPAVDVKPKTWVSYARVFLLWFEYAGLVATVGGKWQVRPDGDLPPSQFLLAARPAMRTRPGVPQEAPRRSLEILARLGRESEIELPPDGTQDRDAVRTLVALGAVRVGPDLMVRLAVSDLVNENGEVERPVLLRLLTAVPGGLAGVNLLRANPYAVPLEVGRAIATSVNAEWTESSTHSIGGHFRAWCKVAGIDVRYPRRNAGRDTGEEAQNALF